MSTRAADALHGIGIGRRDWVAVVLPNGPEMATAFITIAQSATATPLNPAYRQHEYDFYLEELQAKVIVVADDYDGPALSAAQKLDVPVIHLSFNPKNPTGTFKLSAPEK